MPSLEFSPRKKNQNKKLPAQRPRLRGHRAKILVSSVWVYPHSRNGFPVRVVGKYRRFRRVYLGLFLSKPLSIPFCSLVFFLEKFFCHGAMTRAFRPDVDDIAHDALLGEE